MNRTRHVDQFTHVSKVDYFEAIQLTSLGELKVNVFDINCFQCEQHKAVYKCFKIGLSCSANTANGVNYYTQSADCGGV